MSRPVWQRKSAWGLALLLPIAVGVYVGLRPSDGPAQTSPLHATGDVPSVDGAGMASPENGDAISRPEEFVGEPHRSMAMPGPASRKLELPPAKVSLEPLQARLASQWEKAKSGDVAAAAQLARDLEFCANYLGRLNELSAAASVSRSLGAYETQIRSHEDALLRFLEGTPAATACEGIAESDLALIRDMLSVAVRGGDLSSIAPFISHGLAPERLREYLRDPAALAEFRRESMSALTEGVKQCHANSIMGMREAYADGLLAPVDRQRALAFGLVGNWLQGWDPERSPMIREFMASLTPMQINQAIGMARQIYARYCS